MGCQQSSAAEADGAQQQQNRGEPTFLQIGQEQPRQQQQQHTGADGKKGGRYAGASAQASGSGGGYGALPPIHRDIVFSVCSGGWDAAAGHAAFFSGSEDKSWAHFTHSPTPRCIQQQPKAHERCISDMAYAAQSRVLYTASRDKTIRSWAAADADPASPLSLRHTFTGHTLPVSAVVVSPLLPQSQLVSGSRDYHLRLWDAETAACVFFNSIHQNVITDLAWVGNEEAVLQASEDLSLRVWDLRSRQVAQTFEDGPYFALHCDVSPCGHYFLTGHNGFDNLGCELKLFDRRSGRKVVSMPAAGQAITEACFVHVEAAGAAAGGSARAGMYAATSSKDGSLKLWDVNALLDAGEAGSEAGLVVAEQLELSENVQSMASAVPPPDGLERAVQPGHATLATGHTNGRVSVWDVDVTRRSMRALLQSQGQEAGD